MVRLQELISSHTSARHKASTDSAISTCPQMCPQLLEAFRFDSSADFSARAGLSATDGMT